MLKLRISRRQDKLQAVLAPASTTTLNTILFLIEVVLALVAASAALEVPSVSAMGWTFPPAYLHGTAMM
jgi:hypothetical protein